MSSQVFAVVVEVLPLKDDRLLKGNKHTEFFVAVFASNLSGNNNKKVK
jgi:hypothetical protein